MRLLHFPQTGDHGAALAMTSTCGRTRPSPIRKGRRRSGNRARSAPETAHTASRRAPPGRSPRTNQPNHGRSHGFLRGLRPRRPQRRRLRVSRRDHAHDHERARARLLRRGGAQEGDRLHQERPRFQPSVPRREEVRRGGRLHGEHHHPPARQQGAPPEETPSEIRSSPPPHTTHSQNPETLPTNGRRRVYRPARPRRARHPVRARASRTPSRRTADLRPSPSSDRPLRRD
jgi:hypothetical protein